MEEKSVAGSKRRERELARQRYERQQARREAARHRSRRRQQVIASAVSVLVVVGGVAFLSTQLGGKDKENVSAKASASPSPSASAAPTPKPCAYTKQGAPSKPVPLPTFDAKAAAEPYTATIKTSRGDVTVQMLTDKAPCATYSFRWLAEHNFFDKTPCPRVTSDPTFGVLQCGDPTGTTGGGPGYVFPNENLAGAKYTAGTLAMANSGQDPSNGSQFFIVYKDTQLPPSYTPFGRVTKGLDVVTKVGNGGNDNSNQAGGGKPKLPIGIQDVVIAKK
jgi:peptidyl-prolyl cis-trans isomerase B (cyclophilin B)